MVQLKKHTSKKILSRLKRFTGVKIFQSELGNVKAAAKVVTHKMMNLDVLIICE